MRQRALRVVLIESRLLLRGLLADWLERRRHIRVVGVADDMDAGLQLVRRVRPDVAVVCCGKACDRSFLFDQTAQAMGARTVVVRPDGACAGGCGRCVVSMDEGPERLIEAIQAGADIPTPTPRIPMDTSLTRREREVLSLLAIGLSTKETAESLFLSPRTVDNHAHRIMKKLGLHGRVELARYAVREGLVTV